jgi:gliding motility-associated lipoprotein GldD
MTYRMPWLFLIAFLVGSCTDDAVRSPRPRAYPKVIYPDGTPVQFALADCPLTFMHPTYMEARQETHFFDEAPPHPCWFDLHIPLWDADIHCTYSPVTGPGQFQQLVQDAFRLAGEQNKRASYIEDFQIQLPGKGGMAFNMEGPSASPFQFFLTDSTRHFLRGSLYFNTRPNPDSLAPMVNFVKADILQIIESLEWE